MAHLIYIKGSFLIYDFVNSSSLHWCSPGLTFSEMSSHIPVLIDAISKTFMQYLPQNSTIVDATFGAGGYTKRFLGKSCCCPDDHNPHYSSLEMGYNVVGIDRDSTAEKFAAEIKSEKFRFYKDKFSNIRKICQQAGVSEGRVNAFVFDIGVSSMQLDEANRGFSFRKNGPLDMRMDQSANIPTARDILNWYSESQLADLFLRVKTLYISFFVYFR